jgi:hypothetical protein
VRVKVIRIRIVDLGFAVAYSAASLLAAKRPAIPALCLFAYYDCTNGIPSHYLFIFTLQRQDLNPAISDQLRVGSSL